MDKLSILARWVRAARLHAGLTQEQLGQRVGCSKQNVGAWEKGRHEPSPKQLAELAITCQYPLPPELTPVVSGGSVLSLSSSTEGRVLGVPSSSGGSAGILLDQASERSMPVITLRTAADWSPEINVYEPGYAEQYLPRQERYGQHAYVVIITGNSMAAPQGRSAPDGSMIVIDPDLRSPSNGQIVLARLEGSDEAVLREYVSENGQSWLRSLAGYPPITSDFTIIGTAVGKYEDWN